MLEVAELGVVRHPVGVKKMSRLWTEEQDKLLRDICASGDKVAAPVIAVIISEKFNLVPALTRAAVVGRARRLKIKLPIPRPTKLEAKATPKHNTTVLPVRRTYEADKRILQRGRIMPQLPIGLGVYLLNSSDLDCKRPIAGRSQFMIVCGEPATVKPYGVGYCEKCSRIMLDPGGRDGRQGIFLLPQKRK